MSTPLDERRRRALYRATHRGTKEMDWLLGKYADARLAAMSERDLGEFEQLMVLPEPDLQHWLMTGTGYDSRNAFAALIGRIRAFHGLGEKAGNP
jgi:antitoxin CptB